MGAGQETIVNNQLINKRPMEARIREIIDNVETIHTANGDMQQTFSNGARLITDKRSGIVIMKLGEKVEKVLRHLTIPQYEKLMEEAAAL